MMHKSEVQSRSLVYPLSGVIDERALQEIARLVGPVHGLDRGPDGGHRTR